MNNELANELWYCMSNETKTACCYQSSLSVFISLTGRPHNLMALSELEKEITRNVQAPKKVEDQFEEFSAIIKETALSLSQWDIDTEQSISALHKARDEQVFYSTTNKRKYSEI